MSDELKPCPFCGGKAEIISGVGFFCVSCSSCCGETNLYNTEQDAIIAWNKRTQPTFTPDELDKECCLDFERIIDMRTGDQHAFIRIKGKDTKDEQ